MRFYPDEHLSPTIARIAHSSGLDAVCTADRDRGGATDDVQLAHAAEEGRTVVTRNRDDFIALTYEFMRLGLPHAGVLSSTSRYQMTISPASPAHWVPMPRSIQTAYRRTRSIG